MSLGLLESRRGEPFALNCLSVLGGLGDGVSFDQYGWHVNPKRSHLRQMGNCSSHFTCFDRHVKQPNLERPGLFLFLPVGAVLDSMLARPMRVDKKRQELTM